jgi:hypothetical protein
MSELTLPTIRTQLSKQQQLLINEDTVAEINQLASDPDYGPEFLQAYLEHMQVLADAPKNTHAQYLHAVKFFSLVEAGNSLTDAFIKVFPERFEQRRKTTGDDSKEIIRGDASRYNSSKLVNDIRRVATIPVQLIHRHLLHEAILENAKLMTGARSEMVRQKAADTLIRELKPAEDATLKLKIDDGSASVIEELRRASEELAATQRQAALAGVPMKQIAAARIYSNDEEDIIDVEPDPTT